MITIQLNADDLSNLRFAFSPMWELAASYWALRNPSLYAVHLPWIHEALTALEGIDLPHLSALITADGQFANFLTPIPDTPRPSFEDELERLRHVPTDVILQDVANLRVKDHAVPHFVDDPAAALDALVSEVQLYWQRTLAHHWPRIHAVLESDVIYRARLLALEGADAVFNDLHHSVRYEDERRLLHIEARFDYALTPGGTGLTLVPLLFMWNDMLLPEQEVSPVIGYHARGAGLWTQQAEEPEAALIAAFGAGRAAVLRQLTTPLSTSDLAERLNVTPGNVSLHMTRLREAGLVESQQLGKWVFHRLTLRGEKVLALFESA
ncbi:MAG: ArsR family transcriptional regulator [Anaerolineaceae bacterium]|nr:ArsR family transcriptional regulator [Anaerolineaceae bacterium]